MQILKDYLELTGQTQAELAKAARMDVSALSSILSGRRPPGLKSLMRLHEATGISIEKLVRDSVPVEAQDD